ncbi:hypothetical protein BDY24DRAFT_392691 [Mrakia frigida]|uniref:GTPase-activating protein RGD2 n=1 Tax=Mrakia frigida TaxID=29902 RepID=UPI003FCBF5B1
MSKPVDVSLPSTFANSFWSQDYRQGLEVLYSKLEQGIIEDEQIIRYVQARSNATQQFANALLSPSPGPHPKENQGFDADEGAGLVFTFRGLEAQSQLQGKIQSDIAQALTNHVAKPFEGWASAHSARIKESRRTILDGWVNSWENQIGEVEKLKHAYYTKTRDAIVAEEEARFSAPAATTSLSPTSSSPTSTTTPTGPASNGIRRSGTLSQRIAANVREQFSATPINREPPSTPPKQTVFEASPGDFSPQPTPQSTPKAAVPEEEEKKEASDDAPETASSPPETAEAVTLPPPTATEEPKSDPTPPSDGPPVPEKKPSYPSVDTTSKTLLPAPVRSNTSPSQPPAILLAGLALSPEAATTILDRAKMMLPSRVVKLPFLGEYEGCFSGEELVAFLKVEVEGFGGSEGRANDAGRELVENLGLVRRIVAVGKGTWGGGGEEFYQFTDKPFHPSSVLLRQQVSFPSSPSSPLSASASSAAGGLLKRSNTLTSYISSALTAAPQLPPHVKARKDAEAVESSYRLAVRKLDGTRTRMEEVIEEGLKTLQKWEGDRLRAVKTVLGEFQRITGESLVALKGVQDTSALLLDSFVPESDLAATISRYRTGTFRPTVTVFEPFDKNLSSVVFGIDLLRWADGKGWKLPKDGEEMPSTLELVPSVLKALLEALESGYKTVEDVGERRRTWVYEVPLVTTHDVRAVLLDAADGSGEISSKILQEDLPVLAATVKLWLAELNPAVGPDYDDVKAVYPSVGAGGAERGSDELKIEELKTLLSRVPKVKLIVLDAVISHLRALIDSSKAEESDDVYIAKLGFALGRAILRPDHDTALTIEDRAPALFVSDLVRHYASLFPPVILHRRQEVERPVPTRKNTRPVDRRPSRSSMTAEELADLQAQMHLGGKSPLLGGIAQSPRTASVPLVHQNENAARLEDENAPRVVKLDPPAKRRSLKTLKVEEPLPAGFTIQPPTPIGTSPPTDSIPLPPPFVADKPPAPVASPPQEEPKPKPFNPPSEDSGRDQAFSPPTHDDDTPTTPKGFSPPSEDSGRDAGFVPPVDDEKDATFVPPATGGSGSGSSSSSVSRQASIEKPKTTGVRGPRASGPRGAREQGKVSLFVLWPFRGLDEGEEMRGEREERTTRRANNFLPPSASVLSLLVLKQ